MRVVLCCVLLSVACAHRALDLPGNSDGGAADLPSTSADASVLDKIARLCTLVGACSQTIEASSCTQRLIDQPLYDPYAAQLFKCLDVKTCGDLQNCFGGDAYWLDVCDPIDSECQGNTIVFSSLHSQFDCTKIGMKCVASRMGVGACCAVGECTDTVCDGNSLVTCDALSGIGTPTDCTQLGGVCSGVACAGTGDACDAETFTASCTGSVAHTCLQNRIATYDCAQNPVARDCQNGECTIINDDPQCLTGNTECTGSSLRVCTDFTWIDVTCSAIGASSCAGSGSPTRCNAPSK